jgi:hypothetical protein
MNEITFLGISKSQWELYNSFAVWLSAIGTLAAVITSLYLAKYKSKPRAKLHTAIVSLIEPGAGDNYPEFLVIRIVNTGDRNIMVTQIGWRTGLFKKRFAVQMFDHTNSSPIPIELLHGHEAQWFIPLDNKEAWFMQFAKKMLMPDYRLSCFTLRAQVFTSINRIFEKKPSLNIISELKSACKKLT